MRIDNPEVTFEDMIRTTISKDERGLFCDWMTQFVLHGDDGEIYSIALTLMSMEEMQMDVLTVQLCCGRGRVRPMEGSIYRIAEHPVMRFEKVHVEKGEENTKTVEVREDRAVIRVKDYYQLELFPDHSWHYMYESEDGAFRVDFTQRPVGYPLWYGRETPAVFTQHCIQYGYVWSGDTEGSIWIEGKKIDVRGRGIHERAVSKDNSTAEVGAGENWGQFSFDEMHTEFWEMLLSGNQDLHIYDLQQKKDYPEGTLTIERDNWVYIPEFDGFLAHTYHITEEVEDGILEITAYVANVTFWGVTGKRPENPCATAIFDEVEGRFTDRSGHVRVLHNGAGSLAIRQWRPYPNILPQELIALNGPVNKKFSSF